MHVAEKARPVQLQHVPVGEGNRITFLHGRCHPGSVQERSVAGTEVEHAVGGLLLVVAELEVELGHVNVRNDDVVVAFAAQAATLAGYDEEGAPAEGGHVGFLDDYPERGRVLAGNVCKEEGRRLFGEEQFPTKS